MQVSPASSVSVVIPCFNAGRFLESAVASVTAQTHQDWELIIVDDGSDDRVTRETLDAVRGPRIRVVPQPNEGLASARNRGAKEARGAYLQFLDADDLIAPTKLESQVKVMRDDPGAGLVVCDYLFTDEAGTERREHAGTRARIVEPALEDVLFQWERALSIPIHCALFRAGVWQGAEPFVKGLRAKEDWVFWAMLAQAQTRILYQEDRLALYRLHEKSMCRSAAEMLVSFAEAALYLAPRIPEPLRERLRLETVAHLRAAYAARIDDPDRFRPLRHRLVDRLYAALLFLPLMRTLAGKAKGRLDAPR